MILAIHFSEALTSRIPQAYIVEFRKSVFMKSRAEILIYIAISRLRLSL